VITTLALTIVIESLVVSVYARWQHKAPVSLLLSAGFANLLTQTLLWSLLLLFPDHYLVVLFGAELLIWLLESLVLWLVPSNQLTRREALWLSLGMNALSFGLGWFLPF